MRHIALRNMRLYFRDKTSVFFSLLAVIIIIALYVFFLGDMMIQGLDQFTNPAFLIDSWVMSGMLAVASSTTTMGAFGIMVEDRSNNILKDFYASPISRAKLAAGYIVSSFVIGVIMSLVTLTIAEIYIVARGGELLSLNSFLQLFGLIFLSVMAGSAIIYFVVSFFKSSNAFATASTVIGTLIGFLTGIYIPIGNLPEAVQTVIKCFPPSHAAALMRQVMMQRPLEIAFSGAPQQYVDQFNYSMGVYFKLGDHLITTTESILVLVATTVIFYALSIVSLSRKSK